MEETLGGDLKLPGRLQEKRRIDPKNAFDEECWKHVKSMF